MIDAHKQAFKEEAAELLSELELTLLSLEHDPEDSELIAKVFRALHTIKGSAAMFGFDDITMFTHDIESAYDHIRNGEIKITKEIIDLTLGARDLISIMLAQSEGERDIDEEKSKEILMSFKSMTNAVSKPPKKQEAAASSQNLSNVQQGTAKEEIFHVIFRPAEEIFMTGNNPILLLNELRELGRAIIIANTKKIPSLEEIDPEKCYFSWDLILKTDKGIDAIKDVFIFVEDQCEIIIENIDDVIKLNGDEDFRNLEKAIYENALSDKYSVEDFLKTYKPAAVHEAASALVKHENKKTKHAEGHGENDAASSIRVSADKLDELVNLVGELVIVQARLSQIALKANDPNMVSLSEEVERLTWSLRDSALNIRMLPIGSTFSKFKRLVRDLSKDLNKEVELTTDGAETELDKTVIEKLSDPLVHIIRNSIDHGIETPDEREKIGKPRTGEVRLSATQSGGSVLIKISDDGAGMDKEKIRAKAISMGLISENVELSDSEIYELIFAPGFSTATEVTNVSGRGVGMDVVGKAIDSLRGAVEVESKKGKGSTIILKLPLTLAIIDGLLIQIDEDFYVIPLSSVEECIELTDADINNAHGRHIVSIREEIVPYINLRERFSISSAPPSVQQVVIVGIKGNRFGFVVDKVIGQHQTVLKTLGKMYKNIEGISGATILGDGTVALILDAAKIVEKEELEERNRN
jgi:two-component system, chemotaxis family, sensor kinase CheA